MLRDKRVIVTGSTSGIGKAIALVFARSGARVLLHGLPGSPGVREIQDEIETFHLSRRPPYCEADLTHLGNCAYLVDKANEELGGVDILVNNAGVQFTSPVHEFPTKDWERLLRINLIVPFYLSQLVIPQMLSQKWGRMIHMGSVHSLVASVNKSAYVASKHGILGLSKVIALEMAGTGITSNTICPGYVYTPLVQAQIDALSNAKNITETMARGQFLHDKHPSGRFITAEHVAGLAKFLCSPEADDMTGGAYTIDGGWTCR